MAGSRVILTILMLGLATSILAVGAIIAPKDPPKPTKLDQLITKFVEAEDTATAVDRVDAVLAELKDRQPHMSTDEQAYGLIKENVRDVLAAHNTQLNKIGYPKALADELRGKKEYLKSWMDNPPRN